MADKDTVQKAEHKSIYSALAAFQSEMPEVKKTKRFGKEKDTMTFMYAPLDEFVKQVSPITSKNGLAFTWEEGAEKGTMVCALYHESYERKQLGDSSKHVETQVNGVPHTTEEVTPHFVETGVIRSMPITVKRSGNMKDVGGDSTYARRYTLGEVLGIASEDDNDVDFEEKRTDNLEKFAYAKAKEGIAKATDPEALAKQVGFFEKDLKAIADKKAPSLGLTKDQYEELINLAAKRRSEIEKGIKPAAKEDEGNQEAPAEGEAVDIDK